MRQLASEQNPMPTEPNLLEFGLLKISHSRLQFTGHNECMSSIKLHYYIEVIDKLYAGRSPITFIISWFDEHHESEKNQHSIAASSYRCVIRNHNNELASIDVVRNPSEWRNSSKLCLEMLEKVTFLKKVRSFNYYFYIRFQVEYIYWNVVKIEP